jgi:small ligand-binding sensory domain FIST
MRPVFAAGLSEHPVPALAVGEAVGQVLEKIGEETPDLVVVFASEGHTGAFDDIATSVQKLLFPVVMLGCTAAAVVGGDKELEDGPGLAIFAARLPTTILTAVRLELADTPDGPTLTGWPDDADPDTTLLLLADPFSFPVDAFLSRANDALPGLRVIGGLASSGRGPGGNRLTLDGTIVRDGAVGVLIDGVDILTVVSQGCRPVGQPFTVTRSERNVIYELAGQPALERLRAVAAEADAEERDLMRRGLHMGIVVDEHLAEFSPGDFVIRNVIGGDPDTGAVAIGDVVEIGQTVQFHVRDATSADTDLRHLLDRAGPAAGALLFTCNGRGKHLFSVPDHDARAIADALGQPPLAGFFCAGELGPVGPRNFLHGFTASVAVFRS